MVTRNAPSKKPDTNHFLPVLAAPEQRTVAQSTDTSVANLLRELQVGKGQGRSVFGASFSTAFESVWANRTRSLLTMLGIVIGIAAVVASVTMGQGVGVFLANIIASQGTNIITVQPGAAYNINKSIAPRQLSQQDLQSVSRLQHVVALSPEVDVGKGQAMFGNQNWNTSLKGVNVDFQTIQNWDMAEGLWFSSSDDASGQPVALIGDTVKRSLFDPSGTDPLHQKIRFRNQLFRVVGVLAPKGGPQDDIIIVPYKAAQMRLTNDKSFTGIYVEVDTQNNIDGVVQQLTAVIEQNHHILPGHPDDFRTTTSIQKLQTSQQLSQALSVLLSGIAAISLTIGGVGVMNIMLVAVTERTREIGLRMAIGARSRDIRNQFLIEALFLCLSGGVLGLLLGLLIGWFATKVLLSAIAGAGGAGNVPFVVTPTTLLLPFLVTLVIGLVFGLYPAIRASRLDPIVALRRAK